jgi:hypothetical protein
MPIRILACRATAMALLVVVVLHSSAFAAAPLFPAAIHLTRTLDDPLTGRATTLDEYYLADRAVTIAGNRTVIIDYSRHEVTEIDRASATYSVTKFEDIAALRAAIGGVKAAAKSVVSRTGSARRAGRAVEVFTSDDAASSFHAEVAVDSSIAMSRDAFDVIGGSAYPNSGGATADLSRAAAHRGGKGNANIHAESVDAADVYGLPVEQTFRWSISGKTLTASNRVTRIGDEIVPPELVAIPPGAKLVPSHTVEAKHLLDELDALKPALPSSAH